MCGRYVNAKARGDLLAYYDAQENEGKDTPPSWNIAPTQDVPIVAERLDDQGELHRRLITARWGLVPSWAKDIKIGSKLINARRETILEKPSFRKAAVKRRMVLPRRATTNGKRPRTAKKSRHTCSQKMKSS